MSEEEKDVIVDLYERCLIGTYGLPPVTLVKGRGCRVWDDGGRELLDFCCGIATTSIGHSHPHWVERVQVQASELTHVSNLYRNAPQAMLAAKLVSLIGSGKLFFCNSGAEANEALIKFARLYGKRKSNGEEGRRFRIVCAENAFHGRTFGAMSATPQEKIQGGFAPLVDGFRFAKLNDLESFEAQLDETVAAILVEPIQGESGVVPADSEFLRGLRSLCDKHGLLLLFDEVQTGLGRAGSWFAYERAEIFPDAISMAKGLGGGFPIGGIWVDTKYVKLFKPGSHGTTFGGGPLACEAARATIEIIEEEGLIQNAEEMGAKLLAGLREIQKRRPDKVLGARGVGLHTAIDVAVDHKALTLDLLKNGLLTAPAGACSIRLMPPLNVREAEIKEALDILDSTLANHQPERAT